MRLFPRNGFTKKKVRTIKKSVSVLNTQLEEIFRLIKKIFLILIQIESGIKENVMFCEKFSIMFSKTFEIVFCN